MPALTGRPNLSLRPWTLGPEGQLAMVYLDGEGELPSSAFRNLP